MIKEIEASRSAQVALKKAYEKRRGKHLPKQLPIKYLDASGEPKEGLVKTKDFPYDYNTKTLYRGKGNALFKLIPCDEEGEDFLYAEALKEVQGMSERERKKTCQKFRGTLALKLHKTYSFNWTVLGRDKERFKRDELLKKLAETPVDAVDDPPLDTAPPFEDAPPLEAAPPLEDDPLADDPPPAQDPPATTATTGQMALADFQNAVSASLNFMATSMATSIGDLTSELKSTDETMRARILDLASKAAEDRKANKASNDTMRASILDLASKAAEDRKANASRFEAIERNATNTNQNIGAVRAESATRFDAIDNQMADDRKTNASRFESIEANMMTPAKVRQMVREMSNRKLPTVPEEEVNSEPNYQKTPTGKHRRLSGNFESPKHPYLVPTPKSSPPSTPIAHGRSLLQPTIDHLTGQDAAPSTTATSSAALMSVCTGAPGTQQSSAVAGAVNMSGFSMADLDSKPRAVLKNVSGNLFKSSATGGFSMADLDSKPRAVLKNVSGNPFKSSATGGFSMADLDSKPAAVANTSNPEQHLESSTARPATYPPLCFAVDHPFSPKKPAPYVGPTPTGPAFGPTFDQPTVFSTSTAYVTNPFTSLSTRYPMNGGSGSSVPPTAPGGASQKNPRRSSKKRVQRQGSEDEQSTQGKRSRS